jgi:hypothetical protein
MYFFPKQVQKMLPSGTIGELIVNNNKKVQKNAISASLIQRIFMWMLEIDNP